MESLKAKKLKSKYSLSLVCNHLWLKIALSIVVILFSSFVYSQPSMSAKEGIYFLLKVNHNQITDDALKNRDNRALTVRWFDIYVNMFDASNYELNKKDEFKWPAYSTKIVNEINQGIATADFNKIYSYTCRASLGKYDMQDKSFPVTVYYYKLAEDDRITFTINFGIVVRNSDVFDYKLKMDPIKAEKFIESRKSSNGDINRNIEAKVIYNVVNKTNYYLDKWNNKNLGAYVHKIIFMNGLDVLGQINPTSDYYDKVNLVKTNDRINKAENIKTTTPTVYDIDGNAYHTVTIGTQVWMVENLKTTKLNDGTNIPNVTDDIVWKNLRGPGYCWFENNDFNKNVVGALYNWQTVKTGKLAPIGWHVPSNEEWETLMTFLGGRNLAGVKLSELGVKPWQFPKTELLDEFNTNETGFSAHRNGQRSYQGFFTEANSSGSWWSSTPLYTTDAKLWNIATYLYEMAGFNTYINTGMPVRCIKDNGITSDNNSIKGTSNLSKEANRDINLSQVSRQKTNVTYSKPNNDNLTDVATLDKSAYKGHFYNEISASSYNERLIVNSDHKFSSKEKLYFRSRKDKIVQYALFGKMSINKNDEWVYKTGDTLSLKIDVDGMDLLKVKFNGFKYTGKGEYILSTQLEDRDGNEYYSNSVDLLINKKEKDVLSAYTIDVPIKITPEKLLLKHPSRELFLNFLLVGKESHKSIVEGFVKFKVE